MHEEKWVAWEMQTSKKWSDIEDVLNYTNIDFVDNDHKLLVEHALKLNHVISKIKTDFSLELINETKEILNTLYINAVNHFKREEVFMDKYNLPDGDMHKYEHEKILLTLRNAIEDFENGKVKISIKLKTEIMEWVINHINITDYNFFHVSNWSHNLINASDWKEVQAIIHLTGINEIDEQHQSLVNRGISLIDSIRNDSSHENIDREFVLIINEARHHFDYEENFIKKYKIKETDNHVKEHNHFIKELDEFKDMLKSDIGKLDEMKSWILMWWINHTNSTDKACFALSNWAYQLIEDAETLEEVLFVLRLTDIEEVDNDHIELMKLTFDLNMLINDSIRDNTLESQEVKEKVLDYLTNAYKLAVSHFEREELIMKAENMDDYQTHKDEHTAILKRIIAIKENYDSGRLYISSNIKSMILEWWINHTNTIDYRTFVQNKKETLEIK